MCLVSKVNILRFRKIKEAEEEARRRIKKRTKQKNGKNNNEKDELTSRAWTGIPRLTVPGQPYLDVAFYEWIQP